ncbi:MAG: CorA family divalent cation transporter, partial [Thermoplasmata archaeon]
MVHNVAVIETRCGDRRFPGLTAPPDAEMRWVVCVDPSPEEIEELASAFHLHPLVVEDIQTRDQRPKVDEYGDQLFVVLYAAHLGDGSEVSLREVQFLVGPDYLVSVSEGDIPVISGL